MVEVVTTWRQADFGASPGTNPAKPAGVYSNGLKRIFDISLVLIAAPVVLPLIAIMAFLVALDGGPAFYSQNRVGFKGRIFRCWKLRTMVVDADQKLADYLATNPAAREEWDRTQKLRNDPRITPIGHVLRKTSLDELAQLWNVLKGDMSIVGPRPMMPDQAPLYPGEAYYQMRPGITGFWQISERNDSAFAARAVHDNAYAGRMSLLTDIRVMFSTVGVVVRGTGC